MSRFPAIDIESRPLSIVLAEEATSTAYDFNRETHRLSGSLYARDGTKIAAGVRIGGHVGDLIINNDPESSPLSGPPERLIAGRTLYLGNLMCQYGHFITEGLSTFWALEALRYDQAVFHPFIFSGTVAPFMLPFHEAFGLTGEKTIILRDPCRFEEVAVPERSIILNKSGHVRHRRTIAIARERLAGRLPGSCGAMIFLSRSRLGNDARAIENDLELDELFAGFGFSIVHPQEMVIGEQMALYAQARVLAGMSGSAMHNCLFQKPGSLVIEIGTPRLPDEAHPMQVICNRLAQVGSIHIPYRTTSPNRLDLQAVRRHLQDALRQQRG